MWLYDLSSLLPLKENVDTNTSTGKAMMFITATFTQMKRKTIAAQVTDKPDRVCQKRLLVRWKKVIVGDSFSSYQEHIL